MSKVGLVLAILKKVNSKDNPKKLHPNLSRRTKQQQKLLRKMQIKMTIMRTKIR